MLLEHIKFYIVAAQENVVILLIRNSVLQDHSLKTSRLICKNYNITRQYQSREFITFQTNKVKRICKKEGQNILTFIHIKYTRKFQTKLFSCDIVFDFEDLCLLRLCL